MGLFILWSDQMKFALFVSAVLLLVVFSACAPVAKLEPVAPAPAVEATAVPPTPVPEATATPVPVPTPTPVPVVTEPEFDPDNPDWELRYRQLYGKYYDLFKEPELGQPVTLQLQGGRRVQGVLTGLTEEEAELSVGAGVVSYHYMALSGVTRAYLFAPAYADANARAEGSKEYQAWQRRQQVKANTPPPKAVLPPYEKVEEEDVAKKPPRVIYVGIPKNEGPDGRVRQVEEYIRRNAAVPSSLRIKAWGPVQEHDKGYKVRVQYSLQSAGGLGISNEDMMFFMSGRGRVYRRAPVK